MEEMINKSYSNDFISVENEKDIEETILKNPTKLGIHLQKFISNDLRKCTWEKEGNEV